MLCIQSKSEVHLPLHNFFWWDIFLSCKKVVNKLRTYSIFKHTIALENYLNLACPVKRKCMAQFRLSAHRLKIESERFSCKNKY
jgi:hypothetical protein